MKYHQVIWCYVVANFKSTENHDLIHRDVIDLQNWAEICGKLEQIDIFDDMIIITVTRTSKIQLSIKKDLVVKLENLIGKEINLLHTDSSYLIRGA